jgi:eukaryotic-like serine/threonine-protein kinase
VESIGGYRLARRLGEGSAGLVFEAVGEDGARVALKLLRPERAGEAAARARFLREARLAQLISSRHVVPILEVGEGWLVMPYYPSGSLAERLREQRSLTLDETVRLAAELGRGLDTLHEHGILHRDVKPSNVLLAEDGTAALSDFGLARASESTQITHDGQLVGTPHYLAPELIEGAEATSASDLYALGCLLYECLAGAPPFIGSSPAEIGFAHLAEPPPDPRARRPELTEDVAFALLAALEKDPQARPTSGTALARMLHVARSASPA